MMCCRMMFGRLGCVLVGVSILVSSGVLGAQENDVPAIAIDHLQSSGGGLVVNATDGWEFKTVAPVTITSLGVWDHKDDGLNTEIPVGLWSARGRLLASAVVPEGK